MKLKTFLTLLLLIPSLTFASVKGIYISQTTLEDTAKIKYMIANAKAVGINTFVIDYEKFSKQYQKNIELVKQAGIKYVARIIVFNDGARTDEQILSQETWNKKYEKIQNAIKMGAQEIQLDYIRYSSKRSPSEQNSKNVAKVITWFKQKVNSHNIPLQADVFGIISLRPEMRIGQNAKVIGPLVDALCPMVYPSHYEPYRKAAITPYETVYGSLISLKQQFNNKIPFKLYPFIELSNYRWPLSTTQKYAYIKAQLRAVNDAKTDGWYAWSPSNYYDNLFTVLKSQNS